jgi:ADP-ribose pyrophosphatase YjhB (NUDIX family)
VDVTARTLLTFDLGAGRFNYRTVAVVVDGGRVLLHRAETDDFWALLGGRVELGESAAGALEREMREEIGAEARVERLLWVVENLFTTESGQRWHEHALFFLVSLADRPDLYARDEFDGDEDNGLRLIFRWFPIQDLAAVRLYPTFLRERLAALPAATEYFVHRDAPL